MQTCRKNQKERVISKLPLAAAITVTLLLGVAVSAAIVAGRPAAAAKLLQGGSVSTANIRQAETEAGNVVADAVRLAAGADMGIVPAAAFKPGASAPKPATGEQLAGLLEPASDQIVTLNLRGSQVLAALERSVSFAPQPSAGFLQVSGIRFTYDSGRDINKRIVSATLEGKAIDAVKTYKVATTRPLANGQQGYFQIWDKDQIAQTGGEPKTLASALVELARARGGTLSPMIDGRIASVDK
jgi:2',3'-cyclic-nucleotide 2'-phosphodiesterase (5'-nucleotidase family)